MSERDWAEQAPGAAGQTAAPPAAAAAQPPPRPAHGLPSAHYPPIDPPIAAIVARGIASYPASVPRRGAARQLASRTLAPLEAPPLGPGRAAEVGELEDAETLYVGQVLAGKPHGRGRQYLKAVPALNEFGYHLAYDGEWDRGRKCGVGTTSSLSGETYTGEVVDGRRQGFGRMVYRGGDCYVGGWEQGLRSGPGRLSSAGSGAVFVGHYARNLRQGPGTLYMVGRGKKYVAEFVDDEAKCGFWEDITAEELAALTSNDAHKMLSSLAAARRPLPALELEAPFEVLSSCIQQVRHAPPRVRPGCASMQEARGGSPARVTVAPASGGRSSRAAAANDLAAPQPKASSPAAKLLSGAELEAVRLAAACEVAGGGAPRGGVALSAEQLRRVQERVAAALGPEGCAAACGVLGALAAGGGGVTYDGLLAACSGLAAGGE